MFAKAADILVGLKLFLIKMFHRRRRSRSVDKFIFIACNSLLLFYTS